MLHYIYLIFNGNGKRTLKLTLNALIMNSILTYGRIARCDN